MANMRWSAAVVKREIEARLAGRVPAALSPLVQSGLRLLATGNPSLDALLGGGFPLGSLCEITGPECSGRSAVALSLLSIGTREGACAYIDVSDTFSPHSAAESRVLLHNLLWVRLAPLPELASPRTPESEPVPTSNNRRQLRDVAGQNKGGLHPRGETKGLAPALEQMLFYKDERRKRKMEGAPGYPNQSLGLSAATANQVEWEQFNSRKVDERDPLRQLDRASAESVRQRSAVIQQQKSCHKEQKPWTLLDRSLHATDQVLQAGGFRVVVLDIGSIPPDQAQRIQPSSWWKFQKAAKHSDSIFVVLAQTPCAHSSATCVLECSSGNPPKISGVLSSMQHAVQVSRQRTGPAFDEKAPGRVTNLEVSPAWMRAIGK